MFQAFDTAGDGSGPQRADWMALLARAPLPLLESVLGTLAGATAAPDWLRAPETGLMMVQGRAGGTGERFNVGEVTVTRCALRQRTDDGRTTVGVAYVMGRSRRHAHLAALADALLQDGRDPHALHQQLLAPLQVHLAGLQAQRAERARRTKVEFFTVARESGNDTDEGEGEE